MAAFPTPVSVRPPLRGLARGPVAVATAALAAACLLAACGAKDAAAPAAAAGGGMPPVEVGVVTVSPTDVGLTTELPGRLEASRVAQVRARAAGIVQQRLFKEGSDVKAGQALFRIDAAPYAAALASAEAQVAKAQANLAQATATVERYRPLVAQRAVSQQDFVNAEAAQQLAQADLGVAQAAVQTARINRDYANVTSPIAGRIGRALVTEGALVGQGEATPLAVVQQIDPLFVNFTQSAAEVLQLTRAIEAGRFKRSGAQAASVRVVLDDGSEHPQAGKLLFADLSVDSTSGQVTLRAEVPNPGGKLLPGLYVRVRLEQAKAGNAIGLPQQAVTRTQQGDTVTLIDAEGKRVPRQVKIAGQQNGQWVVTDGLKAGEQVMVDGFQKLMMLPPTAPVKGVPWSPAAAAPAAPAAAKP
ncbi:efflux RND transporter periplasmic adaptor subunit [Hydrogenophaga sp. OTU3427]|uniref:efflux RND transporter periplasmic adaptor subunit n=1 Tax=Hydrogenophaga sp. OTU3427 TaxID=3043856 RepID=UPI00313B5F46